MIAGPHIQSFWFCRFLMVLLLLVREPSLRASGLVERVKSLEWDISGCKFGLCCLYLSTSYPEIYKLSILRFSLHICKIKMMVISTSKDSCEFWVRWDTKSPSPSAWDIQSGCSVNISLFSFHFNRQWFSLFIFFFYLLKILCVGFSL